MKKHSLERGCREKIRLGNDRYAYNADRMAKKHGKRYGVYRCQYCGSTHLTTKLENADQYEPLLYITP